MPAAPCPTPLFLTPHFSMAEVMAGQPNMPFQGITILLVEDSRFACDAMRLLCQRSGARMRRAQTMLDARAHLRLYRPDVVIVDMGLPDGCGDDLIRELMWEGPTHAVVLASSGDPELRSVALAAGAAGFMEKPLASLAAFQAELARHLPGRIEPAPPQDRTPLRPDPLALHDDLAHAAALLANRPDAKQTRFVARFVSGIAHSAHDTALAQAAETALAHPQDPRILTELLRVRMASAAQPLMAPRGPKV